MGKESGRIQYNKNHIVEASNDVLKESLLNQRILYIGTLAVLVITLLVAIWQPNVLWLDVIGGTIHGLFKIINYFNK